MRMAWHATCSEWIRTGSVYSTLQTKGSRRPDPRGRHKKDSSFAIVTGASSGIGYELALICAREGYELLIAADSPEIEQAASQLRAHGATVTALEADLATREGVDRLYEMTGGRQVDVLMANAGHGLGGAFLDQDFDEVEHIIDTNITATIYLLQRVGRDMRARGAGRMLITGSIAGFIPARSSPFTTAPRPSSTRSRSLCARS